MKETIMELQIGGIGNYYGGLWISEEFGKYFWAIEDHSGREWEGIPKSLFDELLKSEKSRKREPKTEDGIANDEIERPVGSEPKKRSDTCDLVGFLCWLEEGEQAAAKLLEWDDLVEGELRLEKTRFAKKAVLSFIEGRRSVGVASRLD